MSGVIRNIALPPPHRPASVYSPPAFGAGGRTHSPGGEGVGGSNSSEDARHCSVLCKCKYFVGCTLLWTNSPPVLTSHHSLIMALYKFASSWKEYKSDKKQTMIDLRGIPKTGLKTSYVPPSCFQDCGLWKVGWRKACVRAAALHCKRRWGNIWTRTFLQRFHSWILSTVKKGVVSETTVHKWIVSWGKSNVPRTA